MRRLLLVVLLLLPAVVGLPASPAAAAPPTPGQSTYVPLEPQRLLDTRLTGGPVGPGGTVDVVLPAQVPDAATAVLLNVTALGGAAFTDVRVYPAGGPLPDSSNVVVHAGRIAADLVVVPVGAGRRVTMRNAAGLVHLLADLTGYHAEGPGASYVPTTPVRLLDTRETGAPLGPQEVRTLRVTGGAVPADARAVVLNVTAVGASTQTDVRVYPTRSGPPPTVSSTNPAPGLPPTAALVVATVGDGGQVSLRNGAGTVHLVADLQGWYVDDEASVFHPLPPRRLLDTRTARAAVRAGSPRDLLVAGSGPVPAQATGVALTVTAVNATAASDVRVFPTPTGGDVPFASNLNVAPGHGVANAVLAAVGRDGLVRLWNARGSVDLVVDLAGWYGPSGRGWDVSWPQCTSRGATTSRLPDGGAFAVVGVTRGRPFTPNECFDAQWGWASSLPGEPAVYLNTDAPGSASAQWTAPGPRPCSGASSDAGCAYNYGSALASYAVARLPSTPRGGRPFVWFDVENGPTWQRDHPGAVAVNRAVLDGAAARLRQGGFRYGVYAERVSAGRFNDWVDIMGEWRLPQLPLWVFRAQSADPRPMCTPAESITGGPVQMVQIQPAQSGLPYDVNDLC